MEDGKYICQIVTTFVCQRTKTHTSQSESEQTSAKPTVDCKISIALDNQVLVMRQVIKVPNAAFIDLLKAYDRINIVKL